MKKLMMAMSAGALAAMAGPALAQDAAAGGTMTAAQAGAAPMTGTPSTSYVPWAADSDQYEIQSSKLALSKSKSQPVKDFAREMITDHMMTTRNLMAALPKTNPRVPAPGKALSADNMAKIAQLRSASADTFDQMYMQQQMQAHQMAWSLHKGYATDGTDPALRQVATSAVPIIEKHLQHLKSMPGGGGAAM